MMLMLMLALMQTNVDIDAVIDVIVDLGVDLIVFVTFEKEYVSKFPAKNCFQIVSYKNVSFT